MLLWLMMGVQFASWGYFSLKGGKLTDKQFMFFTAAMIAGQIAAGIETYYAASWRAFAAQAYFGVFTIVGGVQCWRRMRVQKKSS